MSTTVVVSPAVSERTWLERWSPLGGLLFVLGALVLAFTPAADDTGETAAEVVAFARDNDDWLAAGAIFGLISLLLLVWFTAGLAARLRRLGAVGESALVVIGGAAFALLFMLALTVWTAPLLDMEDEARLATAQASTFLAIDDIGWVMLGGAGIGAGLMAIGASVAALRAGLVPSWLAWLGIVLGVAAFATVVFFGIFAWLAWVLLASLLLLVGEARPRSARVPSA